jgi:succinate dehydrogenase/fumarate reductase flavoprotein subunit
MVFGARLAERISSDALTPEPSGALRAVLGAEPIDGIACTELVQAATPPPPDRDRWPGTDVTKLRDTVQRAMTRGAGVVRSADSLAGARVVVEEAGAVLGDPTASVAAGELANLLRLAHALLASALARTESRGAHARSEYPDAVPSWRRRLVHGHVTRAGAPDHE